MSRPIRAVLRLALMGVLAASCPGPARAVTTSTTGAGKWTDAIWNNGIPGTDDDVVIAHNVILTNPTPVLASLIQTAGTLTFSNLTAVITARVVTIAGTLTHSVNTDASSTDGWQIDNRMLIACSNFTLTGTIDISKKGFMGQVLTNMIPGYGPGRGMAERGGGHGGIGGGNSAGYGLTYGSIDAPQWPGSGGGSRDGVPGRRGGNGGGLLLLQADGHVTINGTINANGENSPETTWGGGGGSGGGILIRCATFAATNAAITANGGNGSGFLGGSGGGGRIAIAITHTAAQDALPAARAVLAARFGTVAGPNWANTYIGDYGTVWINHSSLMPASMTNCYGYYDGPAISTWTRTRLALTNCWISLVSNDSAVVSNDVTLSGSTLYGLRNMDVGGNLMLTNASAISFTGNPTNGTSPLWGSLLSVTGTLSIAANCTMYLYSDPTNGGSVFIAVDSLQLAAGGTINADQAGFAGGQTNGYGPGRGTNGYGGAGYGGTGGRHPAYGGATYGYATNPVDPGSGGAGLTSSTGKRGGGLIHITAAHEIAVHGTMTANGGDTIANNICAGSGGGIYLWADTFPAASGVLRARGGTGYGNFGAGGGGRIARFYRNDGFAGTTSTAGGTGGTYPGQTGTVYTAFSGDYVTFMIASSPTRHGTPAPDGYGNNGVAIGSVITNTVDSPTDEASGIRYFCAGWTITDELGMDLSGAGNQAVVTIATNTVLTWFWTNQYYLTSVAGANGGLQTDMSAWYIHGDAAQITPVPGGGYYFSQWLGDYDPSSWTATPLTVTMDRPRNVTAVFGVNGGETKTWIGMTNAWTGGTNWSSGGVPGWLDSVVILSGSVTLAESPRIAALTVANSGRLGISGTSPVDLNVPGNMIVSGASAQVTLNMGNLTVGNDLLLGGAAKLYINSAGTNAPIPDYGVLVTVGRDIRIPSNCWIYPQSQNTNGGSVLFTMRDLDVAAGGGIDANGRGFRGGLAPQDPGGPTVGWGYGRGNIANGGGYGGVGGYASPPYGQTYGLEEMPIHPGSGGGGNGGNPWRSGGNGGGLIRIEATRIVRVSGTLQADGNVGGGDYGTGGGSGGGIYIRCKTFEGIGLLSADGGAGHPAGGGSAGGGGRIAVWRTNHKFGGAVTVDRGSTVTVPNSAGGTIYWGDIPTGGTMILLR